jgi:glycosyltransferase involved in cell wall biosynthesis
MFYSLADSLTPLILTFNEEANLRRTLDSVHWARKVVVVDSESTDGTHEIAASYNNVKWFTRPFDNHLGQWTFALEATDIDTEYVLALDADMRVTKDLLREIEDVFLSGDFDGGLIPFCYQYYGRALRGSLCPPQIRIFKRSKVHLIQPDHTQQFIVQGKVLRFRSRLIHDDQKPLERFVASQLNYQRLNAKELANGGRNRLRDRLRKIGVMPPLVGLLAYVRAGGPFYGTAAIRYAYERAICESLLALKLIDQRLRDNSSEKRKVS